MIGLLTMWVVISALFVLGRYIADDVGFSRKGRIKTNLNAVTLTLNIYDYLKTVDYRKYLTPKSPIQKEIEEKRKEIEKLKKQKADMEELDRLKIEESELFWEVNDPEESTSPHFKWCAVCKNYHSGNYCDCLNRTERVVDPMRVCPNCHSDLNVEKSIDFNMLTTELQCNSCDYGLKYAQKMEAN